MSKEKPSVAEGKTQVEASAEITATSGAFLTGKLVEAGIPEEDALKKAQEVVVAGTCSDGNQCNWVT